MPAGDVASTVYADAVAGVPGAATAPNDVAKYGVTARSAGRGVRSGVSAATA
jgi:hypothetical protein